MFKSLSEFVKERAKGCCEYCLVTLDVYETPWQIDHIVAVKHGGRDEPPNLALACFHCNLHKGTNLAGIDRETGEMVRLFHPRKDRWPEHFYWDVPGKLEARTAVGRVTIGVLRMNAPLLGQVREMLAEEGRFPPGIWKRMVGAT